MNLPVIYRPPTRLVYCPHPICPGVGREVYAVPFAPGETVASYMEKCGVDTHTPLLVLVNDQLLEKKYWHDYQLGDGDMITVRGAVAGGGSESDPVRTALTIAVLAASQGSLGAWANLMLGGTAGASLVAIGGMLLVDALVPIEQADVNDAETSPTYSLSNTQNQARPYQPLAIVMGTTKIVPDLDNKPYTEYVGEDQYLYQTFNFGYSDIVLSDFKIGDTALSDYKDVVLEPSPLPDLTGSISSFPADGRLSLFPDNIDTTAGGTLNTDGTTFVSVTSSANTVQLGIDITGLLFYVGSSIPNGIKNGAYYLVRCSVVIEYKLTTDTNWTSNIVTFDSNDATPIRKSYLYNVTKGQYDVRVRLDSVDATGSVPRFDSDDGWVYDTVVLNIPLTDSKLTANLNFSQLRSYQEETSDYTGQKRVALKIRATGQLQGTVSLFNAVATASCPVWKPDTSTWVTEANSNPAWWFLWFARGIFDASGNRLIGAGLPDNEIDIESIKEFGAFCDSKGLTFNAVIDKSLSCSDVLGLISQAGRGAHTWASGKLGVIWDAASQPVTAVYGMNNIIRDSFSVEYITAGDTDEIQLSFFNAANSYKKETIKVKVGGATTALAPAKIELFGCTDKAMAAKHANLLAAAQTERVRRITWQTDMEGFVNQRGDVVSLSHDLTQWGYSGRLVSGTTTVLKLDRAVPFTANESHYIGVRSPDGSYGIYDVVYQAGVSDTITLGTPLPSAPDDDPDNPVIDYTWIFEPQATPGKKVKIIDVRPVDEYTVEITATDETDAYYLAELNSYTYVASLLNSEAATVSNIDVKETLIDIGDTYGSRLSVVFDVNGDYGGAVIRFSIAGGVRKEIGKTIARRFEFVTEGEGLAQIWITAFNNKGEYNANSTAYYSFTVNGKSIPPADPTNFSASAVDENVVNLTWDNPQDADLRTVKVYASQFNDRSLATVVGESSAGYYNHSISKPMYYWLQAEDTSGNVSGYVPASATSGLPGTPSMVDVVDQIPTFIPADISSGGYGDITFTINEVAGGTANDGEIRVQGSVFYHPDGLRRSVQADADIITPYEGSVLTASAYPVFVMYTDTAPATRWSGFSAGSSSNFVVVEYSKSGQTWAAVDNNNTNYAFSPASGDCIVAQIQKNSSTPNGIHSIQMFLATNKTMPADNATVGATWGVDIGGSNLPADNATYNPGGFANLIGNITYSNMGNYFDPAAIDESYIKEITAGTINVADLSAINAILGNVTAGAITSSSFSTANSGKRVEINVGGTNESRYFDSTGLLIASIGLNDVDASGDNKVIYIDSGTNIAISAVGSTSGTPIGVFTNEGAGNALHVTNLDASNNASTALYAQASVGIAGRFFCGSASSNGYAGHLYIDGARSTLPNPLLNGLITKYLDNYLYLSRYSQWEQILTENGVNKSDSAGHIKLSNGLIINWGKDSRNSDAAYTIPFTQAYSTAPVVFVNAVLANVGRATHPSAITTTNFVFDRDDGFGGVLTINWMAIGF